LRPPTPHRSPKSSRQWPVPTTCVAGPSRMHLPGLAVPLPPPWQSCARRPPDGAGQPELRSRRSRCSPSCRDHPGGFPRKRARRHEGANCDDLSGGKHHGVKHSNTCRPALASAVAFAAESRPAIRTLVHRFCRNCVAGARRPYRSCTSCGKPWWISAESCGFPVVRYARTIGVAVLVGARA